MSKSPITVLIIDDQDSDRAYAVKNISLYVPEEHIHTAANTAEMMRILKTVSIDLSCCIARTIMPQMKRR